MKITKRTIDLESGVEGPRHDPYSYEEYVVEINDKMIVFHSGLDCWLSINGREIPRLYGKRFGVLPYLMFKNMTGIDPNDFVDLYERKYRRCCGPRLEDIPGFPGETLIVCSSCGKVVDTCFNKQAII